ncbi:MAG: hypothetical protein ABI988_08955 [Nitrospirota bacterium]
MKTPAHPFTIHVIEATYVVQHVAAPRPSIWVRAWPYLAQGLTNAGRGLVPSGRVARFVLAALFHLIVRVSLGTVDGIRLTHVVSIRWLGFVFLTIPLFLIGLLFLFATIAFAWGLIEALSRGLYQSHP